MKKKTQKDKQEIVIYQGKIEVNLRNETIWLDAHRVAEIFNVDRTVIVKHINNIYKSGELSEKSTCAKIAQVAADGKVRKMNLYNLDAILSVGYRVNSKMATQFRIWATKVLKDHLVKGYTLNRKVLKKNYSEFQKAIGDFRKLLPERGVLENEGVMELISSFADTWLSLDAYDKAALPKKGSTKRQVIVTAEELSNALLDLKKNLIKKKEATALFGQEKASGSVSGIVGNVFQSFDGKDLYPSIEEKAAHLLYFFVKNHPFTDGNKRSGAFSFIWFLKKTGLLNPARLSAEALTVLTLLVAESKPVDKDRIVGLILMLIRK